MGCIPQKHTIWGDVFITTQGSNNKLTTTEMMNLDDQETKIHESRVDVK